MATIKSYTDIEQSKKLAEILPIESADMMYHSVETEYGSGAFVAISKVITNGLKNDDFYVDDIPCWSLTALIDVLPSGYVIVKNYHSFYYVESRDHKKSTNIFNNPIDACVDMIIKLNELNLLKKQVIEL